MAAKWHPHGGKRDDHNDSGHAVGVLLQKLVGYMPSSYVDLVFAGKRIEVGLKRGKFNYVAPVDTSNKRLGASGAKKKEGDAHAVTSAPTWSKPQQTPHNTYQYA